ncbi:MAG: hypothetical protein NHB32_09315 [Fischerella sp. CENA71]|nr:hypothetical protein [Fischerella sp. CENA71]
MQEKLSLEEKKKLQRFINQAERLSLCNFFENGKPKMLLTLGDKSTKAIRDRLRELLLCQGGAKKGARSSLVTGFRRDLTTPKS